MMFLRCSGNVWTIVKKSVELFYESTAAATFIYFDPRAELLENVVQHSMVLSSNAMSWMSTNHLFSAEPNFQQVGPNGPMATHHNPALIVFVVFIKDFQDWPLKMATPGCDKQMLCAWCTAGSIFTACMRLLRLPPTQLAI
jgi:hypothetical protein